MPQQRYFEQIAGREATAGERARTAPTLDDDTLHDDDTDTFPILTEEGVAATPMRDDSPDEWRVGDIVDGRFVVQQRLGMGRYGPVFKALDRALSDPQIQVEHYVVLEELPPWIAERGTFIERLEQLRLHPQSWSHLNIASVLGYGRDGDRYFLCEELLDGASLRVVLEASAPDALEEHEVLGILRYVGDALSYAHAKGIVHGDLRLDNVVVTNAYEVKLTGFLPSTEPRSESVFVEDASTGGQPHPSDDVYGIACLAYELLTRRHPYGGKTPLEALRDGLTASPPRKLAPERWQALSRGLALRRARRTATVAELLHGLGVTGDETLRPAPENIESIPAPREATPAESTPWPEITSPALGPSSPRFIATPAAAPPVSELFPAEGEADDFAEIYPEPRHVRPRRGRRGASPVRAMVTLVLAAGLATFAYFNHAWLRDRAAGFMEIASALVSQRSAPPAATPPAAAPPLAAPTEAAPPTAPPPTVAAPAPATPAMAEPSAASPAIDPAPAVPTSATEPESTRATPTPAPSEPPAPTQTAPEQPAQAAVAAAAVPEPARFGFAEQTITVNEGDGTVRVVIWRTGSLEEAASVVWWTSDGTAIADEDYAVLGARVARFAAGADTQVLLVPLIADSVPERRETFFVHLRTERAGGPAMQLEVAVLDDDR